MRRLVRLASTFLAAGSALLAACSGGSDEPEPPATLDPGGFPVALDEWAITVLAERLAPGSLTFVASNDGAEAHELTVIRTDLDADALPVTDDDVLVDEATLDVVGTTPVFIAGDERTLTVDLEPGSYVLICNLPLHYSRGMYVGLEVEA